MHNPCRIAPLVTLALAALLAAGGARPVLAETPPTTPVPLATPPPMMTPVPMMTPAVTPAPAMTPGSPAPAATPTAGPTPGSLPSSFPVAANPAENPLITARIRTEFLAWQRGRIDRSTYSPTAGGTYPDVLVDQVEPDLAIGGVQAIRYDTASLLLGDLVYRYEITGTSGNIVSVLYALDARGKTNAIDFTPLVFRAPTASP